MNNVPHVAKIQNFYNSIIEDYDLLSINTQEDICCEDVSPNNASSSKKHNIDINSVMVSNKKVKTSSECITKTKVSTTILENQTKQMSISDDVNNETIDKDNNRRVIETENSLVEEKSQTWKSKYIQTKELHESHCEKETIQKDKTCKKGNSAHINIGRKM